MNQKPFSSIQFIGTQRSGSNLLRVMLNQLPEISAPHPPHILKIFYPLLDRYGNLRVKKNFYQLAADVCHWVNVNPVQWEGVHFEPDSVISRCQKTDLIELFRVIYEMKAQNKGAIFWCCKSMESVIYINELEQSGINPIYIHIYRDGRDVALSFMKTIVGPKHIYHLATKWREEQELSLNAKAFIPENRFISIKYEELIHKPQQVMEEVCQKINVPYNDEAIMNYFHSNESMNTAKSGAMWENLAKPILTNNHHKFLRELSTEQLQIFECIAGDMLQRLGYEIIMKASLYRIDDLKIAQFNKENLLGINAAQKRADPQDILKRRPQEDLLNEIKKRPPL